MRCLVTAGPTHEPLDQVRRLTNFSTGRLGIELARALMARGSLVKLLRGEQSTHPLPPELANVTESFSSTVDLCSRFLSLTTEEPVAVFHAAAVSDFAFGLIHQRDPATGRLMAVHGGKYDTRKGTLLAELRPTPKILPSLPDWFPQGWIVGWKFEVEGDQTDALDRAIEQLKKCRTHLCVVNGPAYGSGFGLVRPDGHHEHVMDRHKLYPALMDAMIQWETNHGRPMDASHPNGVARPASL